MAEGSKLFAQSHEIVDFAIADGGDSAIFVPNRLGAARDVNDAQAADADDSGGRREKSFVVGAAVTERAKHAADGSFGFGRGGRVRRADNSTNAAHQRWSVPGGEMEAGRCKGQAISALDIPRRRRP